MHRSKSSNKIKVGIYAKWLESLGGGEKVATVMAEILSKHDYDVDLIATFKPDKKNIERKMGVNLSRVNLIAWEERAYDKLIKRTKDYDLFINTSFMDHQPSLAKKSLYYIHFPTAIKRTFLGLIKYDTILPILKKILIIPIFSNGLNNLDDIFSRSGKWLDEENTIILSNPPKKFKIKLRIYVQSLKTDSLKSFKIGSPNCNVKMVDRKIDHQTSTLYFIYELTTKNDSSAIVNIIVDKETKRTGVALVSLTINDFRFFIWNLLKRYLPRYEMALYGSSSYKLAAGIDSYNLFMANSRYTKKWTHKYWSKEAIVLNPPVDIEIFKNNVIKKNMILNVGRFFVGGHSKRQDILITTFKEMMDRKFLDKSWELHFVGGVASGWEHANYVKNMQSSSKGYPIYFHFSADMDTLKRLYAESKIYWHATGYGLNELRNPVGFEHFGISVVEAMSAGCVPILYKGGGLIETIGENTDLLWKNIPSLMRTTSKIAADKARTMKLSKYYVKEAEKYSKKHFEKELISIVNKLIHV